MKPFRVPTRISQVPPQIGCFTSSKGEPLPKRRRVGYDYDQDNVEATITAANLLKQNEVQTTTRSAPRVPLNALENQSLSPQLCPEHVLEGYYSVLWRKFTTKKNKTWDGDGVLSVRGTQAMLRDDSGKELGRGVCKGPLLVGSELTVGSKEVEVNSVISKEEYVSGRLYLPNGKRSSDSLRDPNNAQQVTYKGQTRQDRPANSQKERLIPHIASSKASNCTFKAPLMENTVQTVRKDAREPVPRHDPKATDALVMKRPQHVPKGRQVVDVVVDPLITRSLREHQRAGVSFMYECVMGMKGHGGEGAILADEMGLGKTLQTIALLWTLLKQNPIYEDAPVVKKALIVCPVTLIENWKMEFRKWLGKERIGVYVAENSKQRLTDFTKGRAYSVMIIGYELLVKVKAELLTSSGIDIVIADEGHRLKTQSNKAAGAIKELNTERRIILSGTPVQNDLSEFFTMVDFVNPGVLNKYSTFKREFEAPILRSRQPGATAQELEKGEARNEELANLTSAFVLRRTAELLSRYLPTKTEYVVFCRPTTAQASIYRAVVRSPTFNAALGTASVQLELINVLKKICNSPSLLLEKDDKGKESVRSDALQAVPNRVLRENVTSGKLRVLDALLHSIHENTDEKVVLVSNYTSTMDILARLVTSLGYKYLRLDGSTPPAKRQDLVNRFNKSPKTNSFVFLLSAKAGGTGLNLIGASRLIMFDIDWNPATDLQAMARVHRDGQKRPCCIYRLLTLGALDEKIFQRQVSKTGLADSVVDGKSGVSGFTRDELRDLFTLDESDDCQTHKLLGCSCGGNGLPAREFGSHSHSHLAEENGIEGFKLDEDDNLLPSKLVSLSKIDRSLQEIELQRARECKDSMGRAKMLSLMQYAHFDTRFGNRANSVAGDQYERRDDLDANDHVTDGPMPAPEATKGLIEDSILRSIIEERGSSVSFIFTKMSSTRSDECIAA